MHDRNDLASAAARHLSTPPSSDPEAQRSVLQEAIDANVWTSSALRDLAAQVGGVAALADLDAAPLPVERVDTADMHPTLAHQVRAIVDFVERHGRRVLDDEHITVVHRLVHALIGRDERALLRGNARHTAAALAWLALRGNGRLRGRTPPTADQIWRAFGVSSCASRGRTLFASAGFAFVDEHSSTGQPRSGVWFSDVAFLHSRTRASLIRHRDEALHLHLDVIARQQANRAIQHLGDGQVQIRARQQVPKWSFRTLAPTGRAVVIVAIANPGDRPPEEIEALALSIPDARHLVRMLQSALDGPAAADSIPRV